MRATWTTWLWIPPTLLWLLATGRLDLLLIVAPVSLILASIVERRRLFGRNRI